MRKIIFSVATTFILILGNAAALADGSSYPPTTSPGNTAPQSGQSAPAPTNTATQSSRVDVFIRNSAFTPANLTITQGMTVIWTNQDNIMHTVTSDGSGVNNRFDSGQLPPSGRFAYIFNQIGTFTYHCSNEAGMTGAIHITARPGPAPTSAPSSSSSSSSASAQSTSTATVNNYNQYNPVTEKKAPAPVAQPAPTYTPAPAVTYSKSPSPLPNTGPAETVALFVGSALLSTGLYYLYLYRRKKLAP